MKQRITENFLYVQNLEERITYTFSVKAQTIGDGPAAVGNVTTGPQPGSPGRVVNLQLAKTWSAVRLSWSNGNSGRGPILGYYIETRKKGKVFLIEKSISKNNNSSTNNRSIEKLLHPQS